MVFRCSDELMNPGREKQAIDMKWFNIYNNIWKDMNMSLFMQAVKKDMNMSLCKL